MIDIFVVRGLGDKRGEDIVDPLITTVAVALQRGRNELDRQGSGLQEVSVETVYRPGVRLGQLGYYVDVRSGLSWYGKVSGISHRIDGPALTTTLQIEKPTDFFIP
jgi:hypothetical protein